MRKPFDPKKPYFEVAEAAELLAVSPATVRRMFDVGLLQGYRLPGGKHRRISRASLIAFQAPKPA